MGHKGDIAARTERAFAVVGLGGAGGVSLGASMTRALGAVGRKFRSLGIDCEEGLQALLPLVKVKGSISRGADIVATGGSTHCSTVLLNGTACRYKVTESGRRQIFTFQYPGDFCDLNRYVLAESDDAVAALSECSVGIIRHEDLERITRQYPEMGQALWRNVMVEASIFREWLLNVGQRPALARIANLICEQMVRLDAVGIDGTVIPLTQVDLADAAAVSPVHMNRTVQDLRELGILARSSRYIEVVHRDRLVDIAKFNGRYLNIHQTTSPWGPPRWMSREAAPLH